MTRTLIVVMALSIMCFGRMEGQFAPPGELSRQHLDVPPGRPSTLLLGSVISSKTVKNAQSALKQKIHIQASTEEINTARASLNSAKASMKTCTLAGGTQYYYRVWFPLFSSSCAAPDGNGQYGAPTLNFFQVASTTAVANQLQYLYNAKQSVNQVTGDLFTATFPGFQAVLGGTVTAGSSQPAPATGATATTTTTAQTDSVATAVSKLEQGGDFNLRFPVPLARAITTSQGFNLGFVPNVGFTVNGLTAQNTVTESTQYNVNIPLEAYYEIGSYDTTNGVKNAVFYISARAGGELVSSALRKAIGTPSRFFALGQASAGIEFMSSIRIGFQYFLGPHQIYSVPNATGIGTTPMTGSLGGLHLVVSYNPAPKKS